MPVPIILLGAFSIVVILSAVVALVIRHAQWRRRRRGREGLLPRVL